jgi:hypothetical protein
MYLHHNLVFRNVDWQRELLRGFEPACSVQPLDIEEWWTADRRIPIEMAILCC